MPLKKRTPRQQPKLTSSPIADIAFLSLIFFLLTTTNFADLGIQAKMPYYPNEESSNCFPPRRRNICRINLHNKGQLLVRNEPIHLYDLKEKVKTFILNPKDSSNLAEKPVKAIVTFDSSREAKYADYFAVYNELAKVYQEIWEAEAQKRYRTSFNRLPKKKQWEIKYEYPKSLSEVGYEYF